MKFNALIPELTVTNLGASLRFYEGLLGFRIEYRREDPPFCFLSLGRAQLMLEENHSTSWKSGRLVRPLGRGINFQIEVRNSQEIYRKLKRAKVPLFREMKVNEYQVKSRMAREQEFLVMDPDGYLLRFSEYLGTFPLKRV